VAGTETPRSYRCERCGAEGTRAPAFVRQNSFGRARRWACRPCLELARERAFPREARWTAALGLLAGAALVADPGWPPLRFLAALVLNVCVVPMLLLPLVIATHEAGHWLAARALGFDVHAVRIGTGRPLAEFRWRGVPVVWAENPALGFVQCTIRGERWLRTRQLLLSAAGPATHGLWLWLASGLADSLGQPLLGFVDGFRPLSSLSLVNAVLLLVNLLPLRVGDFYTDGARILALPFLRGPQREALLAEGWSFPAQLALAGGDLARAEQLLAEGLRRHPADFALQAQGAALAIERREHERASERLRALLARPELGADQRAVAANDLAWNFHVRGRTEDLADADALSREAQQRLGEVPAVMSTRGGVLADLGRAEEAWALLANALEKTREARWRASILCDLARAEHLLGRPAVAHTRLAEAETLDPRCLLLERARAELAAAPRPLVAAPPPDAPAAPPAFAAPRRRILAAIVAVPAALILWSCPSQLAWQALVFAHADDAAACRAGLARVERFRSAARFWPPLRDTVDDAAFEAQRLALLECAGDVAAARAGLHEAIERGEAALPPDGPLGWDVDPAAMEAAVELSSRWSALARLEAGAGAAAAAEAAFDRGRALAARLDGAAVGHFGSAADASFGRHLAATGAADRALALYQGALAEAEAAGADDAVLLPLLQAYAELLDARGEAARATALYARIGRLSAEFAE
jgi:hypothetical protein